MPHSKLLPSFRRFLQRPRRKLEWIGYQRIDEQAGRSVKTAAIVCLAGRVDGNPNAMARRPRHSAVGIDTSRKVYFRFLLGSDRIGRGRLTEGEAGELDEKVLHRDVTAACRVKRLSAADRGSLVDRVRVGRAPLQCAGPRRNVTETMPASGPRIARGC